MLSDKISLSLCLLNSLKLLSQGIVLVLRLSLAKSLTRLTKIYAILSGLITDLLKLLGESSNLSLIFDLFKVLFGEGWERVVNLAAEIDGFPSDDVMIETLWRDMEGQSFARMADALLKLKELNVPAQGLWSMVPGITSTQIKQWQELIDEDPDQILSAAIAKAAKPDGGSSQTQDVQQANADPELE